LHKFSSFMNLGVHPNPITVVSSSWILEFGTLLHDDDDCFYYFQE